MIQIGIVLAALAIAVIAYNGHLTSVRKTATETERVRVETEARKKNDAAQKARRAVTADNAPGVLSRYYRD
jgi:hypothetical protein